MQSCNSLKLISHGHKKGFFFTLPQKERISYVTFTTSFINQVCISEYIMKITTPVRFTLMKYISCIGNFSEISFCFHMIWDKLKKKLKSLVCVFIWVWCGQIIHAAQRGSVRQGVTWIETYLKSIYLVTLFGNYVEVNLIFFNEEAIETNVHQEPFNHVFLIYSHVSSFLKTSQKTKHDACRKVKVKHLYSLSDHQEMVIRFNKAKITIFYTWKPRNFTKLFCHRN